MYVGWRNYENVKGDSRLSTFNFGSQKHYSIDSALLEKRLTHDTSKHKNKPTVYLLSDLESCYDRQIPAIGGIVE